MIEKIKDIYEFDVISNIKDGKTVFVCDKLEGEIKSANDMSAGELLEILNLSNTDYKRFIFYMIIYPAESDGAAENV